MRLLRASDGDVGRDRTPRKLGLWLGSGRDERREQAAQERQRTNGFHAVDLSVQKFHSVIAPMMNAPLTPKSTFEISRSLSIRAWMAVRWSGG